MVKNKKTKISKNISFDLDELDEFDAIVGYGNRSGKISELMREFVAKQQQQELTNSQKSGE